MNTKIILEFGCNHQGNYQLAKEMIDQAADLGVWAVKFQKRDLQNITPTEAVQVRDLKNSFGETFLKHREALEFDVEEIKNLKTYAEEKGLVFICTAFDLSSFYALANIVKCEYIKLPSQLYKNKAINDAWHLLKKSPRVICSVGMHSLYEILNDSPWLKTAFIVMACNSIYPHDNPEDFNLGVIHALLRFRGNEFVGYSSHDTGGAILPAIIAGAQYIERHFTLNKHLKGSDHSTVSSTYDEIKNLMESIVYTELMLGEKRFLCEAEQKTARKYKK
jgi:sialic acid synthase SpsE